MIDDKDLSLDRSLKMWKNIPIDSRSVTDSLSTIDDFIHYPYIGMIFYSKFEDDYYKVLSLSNGYKNIRNGEIYRKEDLESTKGLIELKDYFIGNYEQYVLKGNSATMIQKAEIRNGYLYITFNDGQETNVGYVLGDPGYSPQISEDDNNNMDLDIGELIYKLNITFLNKINNEVDTVKTANLIGPYVTKIEQDENGYLIFTLSNNSTYKVGPYGIRDMELIGKDLYIYLNNGEEKIIKNIKGSDGKDGINGENGNSVRILGTLSDISKLPSTNILEGDSYIINKDLWTYTNGEFNNVGQIVGSDGSDGKTPEITIYSERNGLTTTIYFNIDGSLKETFKINDGYSPEITVKEETESSYILTITSLNENGKVISFDSPNLIGKDGNGIEIKGTLDNVDELSSIVNPEIGDCYIINGDLWTYNQNNGFDDKHRYGFQNVGTIRGPKGDQGNDGTPANNIEMAINDNIIQWRYISGDDLEWKSLITIEELIGPQGEKGEDGINGQDGREIELIFEDNYIKWKYTNESEYKNLAYIPPIDSKEINNGIELTIGDKSYIIKNGTDGKDGEKGADGINGQDGREIELRYNTENKTIEWKYVDEEIFNTLIAIEEITGAEGKDGKNIEVGDVSSEKIDFNENPQVIITLNDILSNDAKNVYDFLFKIPKGEDGINGLDGTDGREIELQATDTTIQWRYIGETIWNDLIDIDLITGPQGEKGIKGDDGREIELRTTEDTIQWKYTTDTIWNDLVTLEAITGPQGEKGIDGLDSEVSITENENNTEREYKLDISYTTKGETVSFTTPNLKGGINELYEILETLPTKNTDNNLDVNHIYMVKKENVEEIISGQPNYDKYIILNIDENKNITWEKIETAEASGNILVICDELPNIETASTNFIYCLLTPEYQRGLNIGLTNNINANKNHFEEWVVIETEDSKNWELLGPQIYRISASMIDYLWKFNDKFTVYDDWDTADDIPEYQRKHYGEATPLNNFIFRLVPNGSTYNLILVKEVSGGKINKLSIAPQYKVTLGGTTYTCTVTELDGTYNDSYTYYESDIEGNVSVKTYSSEEDFGVQSVFSGVEVYGVYVADTVKKITRGFLYTSNMSAYHIPYDLEIIGDYAFYSTKSPTVQFEKLINGGKDVEAYPLEESKVKAIGVHAFDGNSNLAFLIRNEDGTTKDSNIVRTPATLKKIGDYAFYNTRISTLDTNLSSNLYIGDHSFVQCVHGGQTLSSTTYYTDATFLGVNGLTHDTINYSSAGVSNWFEGVEHAGHNFNFDSGHETDVLHVTLNSVDPDWSLQ